MEHSWWSKKRAHLTERKDIRKDKLDEQHKQMHHVHWGDKEVTNDWRSLYLGSIFQPDGDQLPDIRSRCAMAKTRAGSLRHVWASDLPLDLKIRIYITACCSILVYGSEAWLLDDDARRIINGANAFTLSHITRKTKREEATTATTTFNILAWIRSRRLKWVGHILRLKPNKGKDERLIKQILRVIHDSPLDRDLLMDVKQQPWDQLVKAAADRDKWRADVLRLKNLAKHTTMPEKAKAAQQCRITTKSMTHFKFFIDKKQKEKAEKAATADSDNPFSKAKRQSTFKTVTRDNITYSFAPTQPTKQARQPKKKKVSNTKARAVYYEK